MQGLVPNNSLVYRMITDFGCRPCPRSINRFAYDSDPPGLQQFWTETGLE